MSESNPFNPFENDSDVVQAPLPELFVNPFGIGSDVAQAALPRSLGADSAVAGSPEEKLTPRKSGGEMYHEWLQKQSIKLDPKVRIAEMAKGLKIMDDGKREPNSGDIEGIKQDLTSHDLRKILQIIVPAIRSDKYLPFLKEILQPVLADKNCKSDLEKALYECAVRFSGELIANLFGAAILCGSLEVVKFMHHEFPERINVGEKKAYDFLESHFGEVYHISECYHVAEYLKDMSVPVSGDVSGSEPIFADHH